MPPESTDITSFVRAKLSEPGESMAVIARATGVSKRWLEMMRSGLIPKPGIQHLESVARHYGYEVRPVKVSTDREAA